MTCSNLLLINFAGQKKVTSTDTTDYNTALLVPNLFRACVSVSQFDIFFYGTTVMWPL